MWMTREQLQAMKRALLKPTGGAKPVSAPVTTQQPSAPVPAKPEEPQEQPVDKPNHGPEPTRTDADRDRLTYATAWHLWGGDNMTGVGLGSSVGFGATLTTTGTVAQLMDFLTWVVLRVAAILPSLPISPTIQLAIGRGPVFRG